MNATTYGTSNFVNRNFAALYYARQGFTRADVERKIADGEVTIGRPKLKPGQSARPDEDGRYHITGAPC